MVASAALAAIAEPLATLIPDLDRLMLGGTAAGWESLEDALSAQPDTPIADQRAGIYGRTCASSHVHPYCYSDVYICANNRNARTIADARPGGRADDPRPASDQLWRGRGARRRWLRAARPGGRNGSCVRAASRYHRHPNAKYDRLEAHAHSHHQ